MHITQKQTSVLDNFLSDPVLNWKKLISPMERLGKGKRDSVPDREYIPLWGFILFYILYTASEQNTM